MNKNVFWGPVRILLHVCSWKIILDWEWRSLFIVNIESFHVFVIFVTVGQNLGNRNVPLCAISFGTFDFSKITKKVFMVVIFILVFCQWVPTSIVWKFADFVLIVIVAVGKFMFAFVVFLDIWRNSGVCFRVNIFDFNLKVIKITNSTNMSLLYLIDFMYLFFTETYFVDC